MSTKIRTSNLHTEVIEAFSSSTDSASIQAMIDSNLTNGNVQFNQGNGHANGTFENFQQDYQSSSYFVAGEYIEIASITPTGNSRNYSFSGTMMAQTSADVQVLDINVGIRFSSSGNWTYGIVYNSYRLGTDYIEPVLWVNTSTDNIKLVIKGKAGSVHKVGVNLCFFQRGGYNNTTWNTTVIQDTNSIPSGYAEYTGEKSIVGILNNAVELYHNNVKRFETDAYGALVTGRLKTTQNIDIENTSGYGRIEIGGASGAFIDFKSPFSDDFDHRIITVGSGAPTIQFQSDDLHLMNKSGTENYIDATANGAVNLYYDNVKKIETTAYGADVTGTIDADSATINLLNITQAGGANQMQIKNRYSSGLSIGGNWIRLMKPDFSADMGVFKPGGEVELYHNGSQKFETTSTGVDVTGDINLSGKVVGGGMVLLQETTFTSNTSSVSFDVFDESKYGHYVFYWICNHGPGWNRTYLRFRNSSGDISSTDYYNSTSWKNAVHGTSPTHNSSSYAGNQSYVWLAGNGVAYSSHGYGFISLFADGTSRALARGISQLSNRSSTDHYEESWASTLQTTNPHTNLTGFSIFGSGGNSSFGRFTVFGVERA